MISITASEAARGFTDLIHRVMNGREDAIVTEKGIPVVKVIPVDEVCTGKDLAKKWAKVRHLAPEEATSMEADLLDAKKALLPPLSKWD
ncbi:MAG: type II toxin-antitoxin system Phd/YefM family antitoxin [Prosthecobacter sp.]|nr:type II toxin-antitoxin system Phd/YefM family antitoxin [Prosthecobacter sp.]